MRYVITENENYSTKKIHGCFNKLAEAEKRLEELKSEYSKEDILGYDDNYFQFEDDMGNTVTFQLLTITCN